MSVNAALAPSTFPRLNSTAAFKLNASTSAVAASAALLPTLRAVRARGEAAAAAAPCSEPL